MGYSQQEVLQYVEEGGIKFIRLAFCDVFGGQKNITIMPQELKRAFEYGIAIDGSAISGFGDETHSDLLLHPEADTLMELPWRPEHGKIVRMFANITYPDGRPFECDTRRLLKKAVKTAEEKGYRFYFGAEREFYIFRLDENANPTRIPHDSAGYMDRAPEDKGENIRREICLTLEMMGIQPESSHHEEGPGQNEIDFRYSDPITAADNFMTFQTIVKTVADRNGLYADFGVNKDTLKDLVMFYSSNDKKLTTLKEYVGRMKEDQKAIYYACGSSIDAAAMLPQAEAVIDRGYEVLYLKDDVDEFALKTLSEYDGKTFTNVSDQSLDISSEEEKASLKTENASNKEMLDYIKTSLGDKVSSVRFSSSLKDHPVCLSSEGGISLEMEKVLNSMPQNDRPVKAETILEINVSHPIAESLKKLYFKDKDKLASYSKILYAQARLIGGMEIDNPTELSNLVCELMV